MNILDIAENSVRAGSSNIEITLAQDTAQNSQTLVIKDDGKGMDAEMVQSVTDPFCTTRTTRKVGLGLPFLKMAAELTGGTLQIESAPGVGTTVTASFVLNHIDLAPLGNMGSTIATLVQCNPQLNFMYTFAKNNSRFVFDTREVRQILGDIPLSAPSVAIFIRDYITEQTEAV
ncbi:ATP-binding protein [Ruminococcaceae bacterium OttesenSCG-928-A16]|nr:ATP-binding protein [Ruminococcaceae bacterium OttesenSCG-928-A16]